MRQSLRNMAGSMKPNRRTARILAPAIGAVFAVASPVLAGNGATPVAGKFVRIDGVTKEKSFGRRIKRADHMDLAFTEDRFSAFAVSGTYAQHGKKLRFRVDEERLLAFERSWEAVYEAALRSDGLDAQSVDCVIRRAKLKGRSKKGEVKFKSTYHVRCSATGDFGEDRATGRIRFRGKGQLVDGILVAPLPGPLGPLVEQVEQVEQGPGTGGVVFEIVQGPGAELVLRDDTIEVEPFVDPGRIEPIEGGGGLRVPEPGLP